MNAIKALSPAVILLQETKLYKQGVVTLKGFVTFEKQRKYGAGGGLFTAVHENLAPMMIENDDDNEDILIVDIKHSESDIIRTINCYGPQEYPRNKKVSDDEANSSINSNSNFFLKLQTEIESAKNHGCLICIQMDANSKFGSNIIKGDPNEKMSENGKALFEIIQNNNLVLVNSSQKCSGVITRYRKSKKTVRLLLISSFFAEPCMRC